MGLVEGVIGKAEGCRVRLEEKGVTEWGRKVVNITGGESQEVWCEEEERLFIFWGNEAEAVGVNHVEVFEIEELLVCFGYDGLLLFIRWKFGNLGQASVDGDGASGLGGCQENRPGFVAETADEESFCFFGVVLEKNRAQTEILLEGIPIAYLRPKGSVGEVWSEVIVENTEEVNDGATTTSKKIREDAKEATTS